MASGMDMGSLVAFAVGLIYLASVSGVGIIVLDALNSSTSNTSAHTIITSGITAIGNLGSQLGTIGTVIGVVFLLTVVMSALGGSMGGSRGV